MPALTEAAVRREDITVTYDYILYIAEQAYTLLCNGDLPLDLVEDYAVQYAVSLQAHPNMRQFIARQVRVKVNEWTLTKHSA